ncbi:MAG: hypothetical protein GSR77_03525 [Desulfurococcales archaeon]|nr:hypothetical protein [Desulfurococcales archaeon]
MAVMDDVLRVLAKYGFVAEAYSNGINVYLPTGLQIAGEGTGIRIGYENSRIVVEYPQKDWPPRIIVDDVKELPSYLYYSWLEENRKEHSKIFSYLLQASRRSKPKKMCRERLAELTGSMYVRGDCERIFTAITYLLAVDSIIEEKTLSEDDIDKNLIYFPPSNIDPVLATQLTALRSIVRSLMDTLDKPKYIIEASNKLKEEHGESLLYMKLGYTIGSYLERLGVGWPSILVGIRLLSKGIRHVYPCRSRSMIEAGLLGEALWQLTGDGTVSCRPYSPLTSALSMLYTTGLGAKLVVARRYEQGVKCLSMFEPGCSTSIVIRPSLQMLDKLVSSMTLGSGVELFYYRDKLMVVKIDRHSVSNIIVYRTVDDIGSSPLRGLIALKNIVKESVKLDSGKISGKDLADFSRLSRHVRERIRV